MGGPGEAGRRRKERKGYHPAVGQASGAAFPFIVSFHAPSCSLASDVETEAWRGSESLAGKTWAGVEPKQPLHHFAGSLDDRRELHVVCFLLKTLFKNNCYPVMTYSL